MKNTSKMLAASVGSALIVVGAAQAVASTDVAVQPELQPAIADASLSAAGRQVQSNRVEGVFNFTQNEVSSNAWISEHIAGAAMYMCGSSTVQTGNAEVVDPASWVLEVTGDVANPYQATIGELAATNEVQSALMGCSCGANPADGLAVANALVEGISTQLLLRMAEPSPEANTLVFTSADGYEVALPLSYVTTRYCPLVFKINGSDLIESVGGTNQLWLGSTPGNYFARDIVSIRVEARDVPPADPTSEEALSELTNLPNIGVRFGGTIE